MTQQDTANRIKDILRRLPKDEFHTVAQNLLDVLGYRSERTLATTGDPADLFGDLPNTHQKQEFLDAAVSARIVFQVTDAEIAASAQLSLIDTGDFDKGNASSFLFVAVGLKGQHYSRGRYAKFTREINKPFPMPTVVLFRTDNDLLTLAFVHRRPHKRDLNRDVLGSVSLVREIDPTSPHRAHLDILAELSLGERLAWTEQNHKQRNFDGLLAAWLDALNTEELNRRFYRELSAWFGRAVKEATFPTDQATTLSPEEHRIRLITRLLFVWFMKEKGLVDGDLFVEARVNRLLKDYDRETGDSYYRTVLQNLFFATLNTEIAQRRFSRKNNADHRNFSVYRYRDDMRDPDALRALFNQTPFINGGLFDCLDSFESTQAAGVRIDCFSDVHFHKLSIPNRLFFDDDGLIPLFNHYKFTVEENTPVEQEVALDPELLGKVFENLLAAYNPETRETARKQTGSYYTPRQVVDYMVDEALLAVLAKKCQPTIDDHEFWHDRLRYLLDYADAFNDAHELFDADETAGLVRAIAELKVLDPAVGSGAFPMGVLHKLTLALRRLDPDNRRWEILQKKLAREKADAAFETRDQHERNTELLEISETFEKYRDSDFGRKLYLMQNSIFGVDIQPVACQIAKLRFFISLAIEQEPDHNAKNFGIKPLPNLETRFIAANTLLGLVKSDQLQLNLIDPTLRELQQQLGVNQERQFHAATRGDKRRYRAKAKRLRAELGAELERLGMPAGDTEKVAAWDPDDQNAPAAEWFDAEYMFGIKDGFDVVIGNPPYIQLQKNGGELGKRYREVGYDTFTRTGDIYQLFYERGCQLLRPSRGLLAYITSNSWLKAEYGKPLRRYFARRHRPLALLEMGKDVFEHTIVDTSVLILREGGSAGAAFPAADLDRLPNAGVLGELLPPTENLWGQVRPDSDSPWSILSATEQRMMDKMQAKGTPLKDWDVRINRGILTGYNAAFIIDEATRQRLISEDPKSANIIRPILRGRDIQRYRAQWAGQYLIDTHNGYGNVPAVDIDLYPAIKNHLDGFHRQLERRQDKGGTPYNLRNCAYHEEFAKEKLFWIELVEQGRFAYDDTGIYGEATTFILTGKGIKFLCAVLNTRLVQWFLQQVAPTSGMGVLRWKKVYVEIIPIPKIPAAEQHPFTRLVDDILTAKEADTSQQESEIDQLVYGLYGLDDGEIKIVEAGR